MPSRGQHFCARRQDHAWIFCLPHDLGAEVEEDLTPAVERALASDATLIILDFSPVSFTNTAGIGALVDLLRRMRERAIRVVVAGAAGQPGLVLERVGFFDFAPRYDSVDHALGSSPAS